ncbi:glucan exo-1,3-beta-glucosidase [Lithohypha guttulata]|uniref:Glucan exo-1,3-beta-glucosidase n=1 Tax=Lithohypha guttulata TaxID=1690604 RepID=A0AAN7YKA6_9EURO|nr:glucan exo-1,3-beta-glucosidase [Lithohypha guttulata]KAK5100397.1 glucan exo-1,3-beta-glucosidase [Lithohypha guttulata]
MLVRKALLLLATACSTLSAPILDKRQGGPTRGVSLGGWLVLEPWITPSIFQAYGPVGSIVDEYTLCQNDPNAGSVLQAHWSSWVTLGDFQKIASSGKGINTVRIPIGYWAFQKYGNDPYVQGAKEYLARALDWASQTGLKVWIDLHGAPLSQNGFDNSGQRTSSPQWTSGDTIGFTAGVLGQIAQEFGNHPAVSGVQLLNEPLTGSLPGGRAALENYYNQAYGAVRSSTGAPVVISDGFAAPSSWNGIIPDSIIDHHEYQVFSNGDVAMTAQQHVDQAYARAASWGQSDRTLICGEWTAAMTDCAAALNGYGIGARYDGTYSKPGETSYYVGSCATKNFIDQWDQGMKDTTRNYIQAQINAFEQHSQGWIFWNFKTEASAEWDFFRLLDNGVWP